MSKKVKIFAIVIGIISVAILVFTYLGNSAPVEDPSDLVSTVSPNAGSSVADGPVAGALSSGPVPVSGSFLQVLSTMDTITLDTSIFSSPAYKALRDFPINLGTAVIGRQNPFAPIGTDTSSSAPVASLEAQTLAPGKITSTGAEFGALITSSNPTASTVVFQYGTSDTFGSSTPPVKVSQGGTALATVKDLTPDTTYYVEAVAVYGSATASGSIMTFTTAPAQKR